MYKNLVLSGGGVYGCAFIGALRELRSVTFETILGSSVGSIVGLMLALGYDTNEIEQECCNVINILTGVRFVTSLNLMGISSTYGLDDGSKIEHVVSQLFEKRGISPDITFVDLVKSTGVNLIICATNLTVGKVEYLGVDTTPNLSVLKAIRMSTCVPFLYQPVLHKNCVYVDSLFCCNFPIQYFSSPNYRHTKTLGIKLISPTTTKIDSFGAFLQALVNTVISESGSQLYTASNIDLCEIDCSDEENFNFMKGEFSLDKNTMKRFISLGENAMNSMLKTKC